LVAAGDFFLSDKSPAFASQKLFMRQAGDNRDDRIVKREIYEREIKGRYNVRFVLDDRNKVVALWRDLGLPCFQVADGDF
jgi:adenylate cyclase class IV